MNNDNTSTQEFYSSKRIARVLVVCSGGISSTSIETALNKEAKLHNLNYTFKASSVTAAKAVVHLYDVCILLPQVKYIAQELKSEFNIDPIILTSNKELGRTDTKELMKQVIKALDLKIKS